MTGNFELFSHNHPFLARLTPNDPLFRIFTTTDPYFRNLVGTCTSISYLNAPNPMWGGEGGRPVLFWAFGPSEFWSKQCGPCKKLFENPWIKLSCKTMEDDLLESIDHTGWTPPWKKKKFKNWNAWMLLSHSVILAVWWWYWNRCNVPRTIQQDDHEDRHSWLRLLSVNPTYCPSVASVESCTGMCWLRWLNLFLFA